MTDRKRLAEDGWGAWFAHDIERLMTFYTDDSEVILPGSPPARGTEAIRATWQAFMTAFPDERPTEIRHLVDGDTIVTEWKTIATHAGPLPMPTGEMLPATGKTVELAGVTVADIQGDKVKRQAFYFDNAGFMQQLGLMPEPQTAAAH